MTTDNVQLSVFGGMCFVIHFGDYNHIV